jgi:hypothetical protein
VIAVTFYGAGRDANRGRDFFADLSGGEQLDDFEFARGEGTAGEEMIGAGFALALFVDETFDAVLSNGLLAIRMGKAGPETPVPRVA